LHEQLDPQTIAMLNNIAKKQYKSNKSGNRLQLLTAIGSSVPMTGEVNQIFSTTTTISTWT